MGILDIQPDELRKWMSLRYGYDDGDEVKDKSGMEYEMYKNGTWMIDGRVVIRKNINNSSSKHVGSGKIKVRA